ncbi:hypothetical protein [Lentisalinibacter orientalis]|uniref:hypothetical protein n=1 Tax=Lentisalinibacter orientalis TaxID=2992241 RepID=UPI0038654964
MTEEVTATYGDATPVKNVEEDLRALGIPSETIYVDRDNRKIRVKTAESTKAEIMEVLKRHEPVELS